MGINVFIDESSEKAKKKPSKTEMNSLIKTFDYNL